MIVRQRGRYAGGREQRYIVRLTESERTELERLIAAGTAPARTLMHARLLLKADRGPGGPAWVETAIAEAVEVSQPTIARVRPRPPPVRRAGAGGGVDPARAPT